jgi:hypothetical protein
MTAMTTVLTYVSSFGDTLKMELPTHTVQMPATFVQKRKVPSSGAKTLSGTTDITYGTVDADDDLIPERIKLGFTYSLPVGRKDDTELDLAVAVFRDYVNSNQFTQQLDTQKHIPLTLWT